MEELKLFATDIAWNIDEEDYEESVELPEIIEIPRNVWREIGDLPNIVQANNEISDWISDKIGFLYDGFKVKSNWTKEEFEKRIGEITEFLSKLNQFDIVNCGNCKKVDFLSNEKNSLETIMGLVDSFGFCPDEAKENDDIER